MIASVVLWTRFIQLFHYGLSCGSVLKYLFFFGRLGLPVEREADEREAIQRQPAQLSARQHGYKVQYSVSFVFSFTPVSFTDCLSDVLVLLFFVYNSGVVSQCV